MTIRLTSDQEKALQRAIETGLVHSVGEFIDGAIGALPLRGNGFDKERARAAVARIRDLRGMSMREFAHIGHKY